jgi:hypothetical protein
MSKYSRHQSVVNRNADESIGEDHWLKQFEKKLQKGAVRPANESLYQQISHIMNTKSKYPSVQAAVDDMMQRSGLTAYLQGVKTSTEETDGTTKTAADQNDAFIKEVPVEIEGKKHDELPIVIKKCPAIGRTLENYIKSTRGNLPVPAIILKLQSIHSGDVSDARDWEDEDLIRLVSKKNLQAKKDNPAVYENYDNLGASEFSGADSEIDASNTDAFNALMPAKI